MIGKVLSSSVFAGRNTVLWRRRGYRLAACIASLVMILLVLMDLARMPDRDEFVAFLQDPDGTSCQGPSCTPPLFHRWELSGCPGFSPYQ